MVELNDKMYINPYNFITLDTKCNKNNFEHYAGNLTGYIECTLTSKTPLFIPDTSNTDNTREYIFFNYGEKINDFIKPVIPGSEIRGMLRNDFEVFTNSCMSTLNMDISFISRNSKPKNPGILKKDEDGNWHLYKAIRHRLHTTRDKVKNNNNTYYVNKKNEIKIGEKIYKTGSLLNFENTMSRQISNVTRILGEGNKGILFIGELGGQKVNDSIFEPTNQEIDVVDLNTEVKKLKDIFDLYNDKAFNQKIRNNSKTWYAGYDFKAKVLPVWYSNPDNKKRVYLSLASMGKEAYHRTLNELVKSYKPCIDKYDICEACDLFGFVSDSTASSSKIRISDALYNGINNPYMKKITLKELASPHISNAHFYALFTPDTGFTNFPQTFDFNYDSILTTNKKESINSDNITIRGRKTYWHHFDLNKIIDKPNDRNCDITPIKDNCSFTFKVYFDDISKDTLDKLISVINLKYNDKDLCHKIGKGKPLGLGSCKINVDDVYLKNIAFDNGLEYNIVKYDDMFDNKLNNLSLNDFIDINSISMIEALRIYDFNYLSNNYPEAIIDYPQGSNKKNTNSMLWFMNNKSKNVNKNSYVIMVLPRIIDGFDDNGNEGLKETELFIDDKKIGSTHGLLIPGNTTLNKKRQS